MTCSPKDMRLGAWTRSVLTLSCLVIPACGGVSIDDGIPATQPSTTPPNTTPSECKRSSCPKCQGGYVNQESCANGQWSCKCVPQATCTAAPACSPGDQQIPAGTKCPAGSTCYSQTTCGSTIQCATQPAQCDGYPSCDPGDEEAAPPECAASPGCYQRSLCGTTILCKPMPIWSAYASKLVATDDGGGWVPTPPPGSACRMGETEYTFTTASGQLAWKICKTSVTPYVFTSGTKTLTSAAAQSIKAAAGQLKLSTKMTCGADKSVRKVQITSPSNGTREYLDSFYACEKNGTYVDNIDGLFSILEVHRN